MATPEMTELERGRLIGLAEATDSVIRHLNENQYESRAEIKSWARRFRSSIPPVPQTVRETITKDEGMRRAEQQRGRELFIDLFREILRRTLPHVGVSTDDVWAEWDRRGYPDIRPRQFAGTAGRTLIAEGACRTDGEKVKNEAGNSHSNEENLVYYSLIYRP